MKRTIIWDNSAKAYFKKSVQYIKRDSPPNADNIIIAIRLAIGELPANPQRYPADKYRIGNTGNYRAFEL